MNAVPALPAVPDAVGAPLPVVYEAAQKALAECSKVDECKSWADKAAALASYARQAKDDSLRVMAVRIQARAERRCGELLKLIPSAQGVRTDQLQEGAHPKLTRESAATEAGLSEHQRKTALRVASIPESDFERQVESAAPPSVTQLAGQGTAKRQQTYVPDDIQPAPIEQGLKAQNRLREFAAFCGITQPAAVARACASLDIDAIRGYVETIDSWLDRFVVALPAGGDDTGSF